MGRLWIWRADSWKFQATVWKCGTLGPKDRVVDGFTLSIFDSLLQEFAEGTLEAVLPKVPRYRPVWGTSGTKRENTAQESDPCDSHKGQHGT
jgi:hypothetical protein